MERSPSLIAMPDGASLIPSFGGQTSASRIGLAYSRVVVQTDTGTQWTWGRILRAANGHLECLETIGFGDEVGYRVLVEPTPRFEQISVGLLTSPILPGKRLY